MAFIADFIPPFHLPVHYTSYVRGETPLSTTPAVATLLSAYIAVVLGCQVYMRDKEPKRLTALFQAHNLFLSVGSLVLLVLILDEIIPIYRNNGFFYSICSEKSWTPRLEFYYMINHHFKCLELFDTVFLVLKKKPLQLLHVYHHFMTAVMTYCQLNCKPSMAWVVISLNLAVHVVMYYYYYATAGGARLWWKKYLTSMQITQFVIDLGIISFGAYSHYASIYFKGFLPSAGNCAAFGFGYGLIFALTLLGSYLALFIRFYFQTYKKLATRCDGLLKRIETATYHAPPTHHALYTGTIDQQPATGISVWIKPFGPTFLITWTYKLIGKHTISL